jgi:hypothetical protein
VIRKTIIVQGQLKWFYPSYGDPGYYEIDNICVESLLSDYTGKTIRITIEEIPDETSEED